MDIIIFTTINDEDLARDLVQELLEAGLIRNGTIFPNVETMYIWDGQITIDEEFKILLKTTEGKYPQIEEYIMKNHPYMIPEIIKINAEFGSDKFKQFVKAKREGLNK